MIRAQVALLLLLTTNAPALEDYASRQAAAIEDHWEKERARRVAICEPFAKDKVAFKLWADRFELENKVPMDPDTMSLGRMILDLQLDWNLQPEQKLLITMHPSIPWVLRLAFAQRLMKGHQLPGEMLKAVPKEVLNALDERKHYVRASLRSGARSKHYVYFEKHSKKEMHQKGIADPWVYYVQVVEEAREAPLDREEHGHMSPLEGALKGLMDLSRAADDLEEAIHYSDILAEILPEEDWACAPTPAADALLRRFYLTTGSRDPERKIAWVKMGCEILRNGGTRIHSMTTHGALPIHGDVLMRLMSDPSFLYAGDCRMELKNDRDVVLRWAATSLEWNARESEAGRLEQSAPERARELRQENELLKQAMLKLSREILGGKYDEQLKQKCWDIGGFEKTPQRSTWEYLENFDRGSIP